MNLKSSLIHVSQVMIPFNLTEFINDLTDLVKNNVITMDRIDDAVGRILLVKFSMGLFENPLADLSLVNELGSQVYLSNHYLEIPKFSSWSFIRNS